MEPYIPCRQGEIYTRDLYECHFSMPYIDAEVIWNFTSEPLNRFLWQLHVTWRPIHLDVYQVTAVAGLRCHHNNVIMSVMASQITSLTIVYSTVYQRADQRKNQSSASLAFVREIHRWPVNPPHKGSVTRKIFPFDDVVIIMLWEFLPFRISGWQY